METTRAPDRTRPRSPLRRREFRAYFIGNLLSNVGNWIANVALGVYMLELTGSSFWVGIVGLGLFLPVLLFALPAGALADRVDRLRLLLSAQAISGVLSVTLTVLVALDVANRYLLAVVAFGLGVGVAVAIPTMQAMIPHMVPPKEYPDALGMNALTFNVARLVGPLVASAALASLGAAWAFGMNAASFVPLIVALALIRTPPFPRPVQGPPGPVREGLVYAWRHLRTRWMLLSIVAIGVSLDPIITLSPALAVEYGLPRGGAGWIVAAWGGGAVVMILFGRGVIRAATHHGLGWAALVVLAIGVAALGASPSVWLAIPACLLAGIGYITATMVFTTVIQGDVPESMRGRVSALWTMAFLVPRGFAAVGGGALADAIGPRAATASFCVFALAAAVLLRRVEAPQGEPVPPPA